MCTWLAVEVIDYYMRQGSEVFIGFMDMTKTMSKVKQSLLFQKLNDSEIPEIYPTHTQYVFRAKNQC